MPRAVRYRESFRHDLAAQLDWLRQHRPPGDRIRLRTALASFTRRVASYPALGFEVERHGVASYRVFHLGPGLPYLIWYVYDTADARGAIRLMLLGHEAQDREHFVARLDD